jgi:hypothetical protein
MAVAPGHAHLQAIKILHHDNFLAPRQFVPRHCASARLHTFCNRDNLPATYQLCTATRVMLNKICTRTAKTRAIPSLHRDSFLAKVPGLCPVLLSGNTTSLYCRAVIANVNVINEIDHTLTTHPYTATAHLAHLLLRDAQPNTHAKAKEPNYLAPFD